MSGKLDTRLLRLKSELDDHARIARYLGLDFERPIQSLGDGYPENAMTSSGCVIGLLTTDTRSLTRTG
jgi:hypothetical protein